jgi:hypothetical protein
VRGVAGLFKTDMSIAVPGGPIRWSAAAEQWAYDERGPHPLMMRNNGLCPLLDCTSASLHASAYARIVTVWNYRCSGYWTGNGNSYSTYGRNRSLYLAATSRCPSVLASANLIGAVGSGNRGRDAQSFLTTKQRSRRISNNRPWRAAPNRGPSKNVGGNKLTFAGYHGRGRPRRRPLDDLERIEFAAAHQRLGVGGHGAFRPMVESTTFRSPPCLETCAVR